MQDFRSFTTKSRTDCDGEIFGASRGPRAGELRRTQVFDCRCQRTEAVKNTQNRGPSLAHHEYVGELGLSIGSREGALAWGRAPSGSLRCAGRGVTGFLSKSLRGGRGVPAALYVGGTPWPPSLQAVTQGAECRPTCKSQRKPLSLFCIRRTSSVGMRKLRQLGS